MYIYVCMHIYLHWGLGFGVYRSAAAPRSEGRARVLLLGGPASGPGVGAIVLDVLGEVLGGGVGVVEVGVLVDGVEDCVRAV